MFVGGGPAGTAGGIKVTTALVIAYIGVTEIRGERAVNALGTPPGADRRGGQNSTSTPRIGRSSARRWCCVFPSISRRVPTGSSVVVIGLGRFGSAMAEELEKTGTEVLAIDASAGVVHRDPDRAAPCCSHRGSHVCDPRGDHHRCCDARAASRARGACTQGCAMHAVSGAGAISRPFSSLRALPRACDQRPRLRVRCRPAGRQGGRPRRS